MQNRITYDKLIKISEKLDSAENKDWDNCVETLYVNYLISIIEGSYDTDELSDVYIKKSEYDKQYNKFYREIDNALEEIISSITKDEEKDYHNYNIIGG